MNLHKLIFTENDCYKAGRKITVKGVMVHSTGANNPDLRRYVGPDDGLLGKNIYGNHWNQAMSSGVCVHAFIGRLADGTIATYQTLPWEHRGWHSGSGKNGSANNTHISFEICEDGLTDAAYFAAVYKEAVELTAYLCKQYGLDPLKDGVIIDHGDGCKRGIASNHGDVMHWFPKHGKSMYTFRADVYELLTGGKVPETPAPAPTTTNNTNNTAKETRYTMNLRTLKQGVKGEDVKALQILLIGRGFSCGSSGVDGSFGPATDKAVRAYQKAHGLEVDGKAGPATMGSLLGV